MVRNLIRIYMNDHDPRLVAAVLIRWGPASFAYKNSRYINTQQTYLYVVAAGQNWASFPHFFIRIFAAFIAAPISVS